MPARARPHFWAIYRPRLPYIVDRLVCARPEAAVATVFGAQAAIPSPASPEA